MIFLGKTMLLLIFGGLFTSPVAAQQGDSVLQPLMHPAKDQKELDSDLFLITIPGKLPLKLIKNLAGEDVLVVKAGAQRPRAVKMCILADGASYPNLSLEQMRDVLSVTLTPWLAKIVPIEKSGLQLGECLDEEGNLKDFLKNPQYPEFMVIERRFLPALKTMSSYQQHPQLFLNVGLISKDFFLESQNRLLTSKQKADEQRQSELTKFAEAAQELDVTVLGSLVLQTPKEKVNLCGVTGGENNKPFFLGYAFNYANYVPKSWILDVKKANPRVKFENTKYFSQTFKTVDDFYIKFKSGSTDCHIFIGFPADIAAIRNALTRDTGKSYELLGALVANEELADAWAKAVGYQSFSQYIFAEKIGAKAEVVKGLVQFKIDSEAKFVDARSQMLSAKYGSAEAASDVLSFLRDKQVGEKEGKTANVVRTEREKRERAELERRTAEQKKIQKEYASKYPYTAVISCSIGESAPVTLNACFVSKYTQTELEIKNGTEYRMFTPHDLFDAGQITEQGLEVPLRSSFSIAAQNAGEGLLLTLRIVNNSSGKTEYKKSAAQFGLVKVAK